MFSTKGVSILLATLSAGLACSFDTATPVQYRCSTEKPDCPSGLSCDPQLGICVARDAAVHQMDATAPLDGPVQDGIRQDTVAPDGPWQDGPSPDRGDLGPRPETAPLADLALDSAPDSVQDSAPALDSSQDSGGTPPPDARPDRFLYLDIQIYPPDGLPLIPDLPKPLPPDATIYLDFSASLDTFVSQPEICDNQDNDGDGTVDQFTQSCYTGPPETEGVGVCQAGTQLCSGGKWGQCQNETIPSEEICNNEDDDCDGTADRRPCYDYSHGCWVDSATGDLKCHAPCAPGYQECDARGGGWGQCITAVGPAAEESCGDGVDNDCNGLTDQRYCFSGAQGCYQSAPYRPYQQCKGLCKGGKESCNGGVWSGVCDGEIAPTSEVCNNKDDDCDGDHDEDGVCL